MAKKTMLEQARTAYSKNKNTKYTWEDGKKTEKKKKKKKDKTVASSYGQVEKKTQTVGSQGKKNRSDASVKKAASSVKNNLTPSKSGAVKPVASHYGNVAKKASDRTFTDKKWTPSDVAKGVKTAVNPRTVKKTDETDYVKENKGTATGSSAKAYNAYKQRTKEKTDATTKKITTKSPLGIAFDTATEQMKYVSKQPFEASKWYDKEEKKANKEGMTYGEKKEFIKRWMEDPDHVLGHKEVLDEIKKQKKAEHTYEYSNMPVDSDTFFRRSVYSQFANNRVKTETNIPKYQLDEDGNIKYDKNGKPKVQKDKNGNTIYQKIDSTQGNNIADYYAGGFDKDGRLANQKGSQQIGSETAGWMHNAPVAAGVMQGLSYSDIKRGLGNYTNAAAEDVNKITASGKFNAGYMGGIMAQFGISRINSMAKALMKSSGQSVSKTLLGNAGRAMALDTPLNFADAMKMGTDANGNIDPKAVALYMGINTAMSGAMPLAIEGAGAKWTMHQSKELLRLTEKESLLATVGKTLSPEDAMKRDRLIQQQAKALEGQVSASAVVAGKTLDEISSKGGNSVVNVVRAKVKANPQMALGEVAGKVSSGKDLSAEDFVKIGAVKEAARDNGDFELAGKAQLELRKMREQVKGTELERQANAMRVESDSLRKIEISNIEKEADIDTAITSATNNKGKITSQNLTDLEGAVEYAKQINNPELEAKAQKALTEARAENKKLIEGINNQYKAISDKLDIPIQASTKRELDAILRENGNAIPDGNYGGFVLRNKDGSVRSIHVNADAPESVSFVVGHELSHVMELAKEDFSVLAESLKKYKGGSIWKEEADKVIDLYAGVKNANYERETIANTLGRVLTQEGDEFLENLYREDKNLFERIYDFFRKLLAGESKNEDLVKIETTMRKILDEYGDDAPRDTEFLEQGADADFMMIGGKAKDNVSGIRQTSSLGNVTEKTIKNSDYGAQKAEQMLNRKIAALKRGGKKPSRKALIQAHEDVRRTTGWVLAPDGSWQFEIHDTPARFNFKLTPRRIDFTDADLSKLAEIEQELTDTTLTAKRRAELVAEKHNLDNAWGTHGLYDDSGADLGDVLHHPELFKAYPSLARKKVKMVTTTTKGVKYSPLKIARDPKTKNILGVAWDGKGTVGELDGDDIRLNAHYLKVPKGETIHTYADALRASARENFGAEFPRASDFDGLSKSALIQYADERGIDIKIRKKGKTLTKKTATREDLVKFLSVDDKDMPKEYIKTTLLHETQHAIQRKEGWATGGSPSPYLGSRIRVWNADGSGVFAEFIQDSDFTRAHLPENQKLLDAKRNQYLKALTAYTETISKQNSELDRNSLLYLENKMATDFRKEIIDEYDDLKKAYKKANGKEPSAEDLRSAFAEAYSKILTDFVTTAGMHHGVLDLGSTFPETKEIEKALANYFKVSGETRSLSARGHDIYTDLIGERQSRMTQKRSLMTAKERTETSPIDPNAVYRYAEADGMPSAKAAWGTRPTEAGIIGRKRAWEDKFSKIDPDTGEKVSASRINEKGRIEYDTTKTYGVDFSILDSSEKVQAQKAERAKSSNEKGQKLRDAMADQAKKSATYGKDSAKGLEEWKAKLAEAKTDAEKKKAQERIAYFEKIPSHAEKERIINEAWAKAYDERTGTVSWGTMREHLDSNGFLPNQRKAIISKFRQRYNQETVTVTKPKTTASEAVQQEEIRTPEETEAVAKSETPKTEAESETVEAPIQKETVEASTAETPIAETPTKPKKAKATPEQQLERLHNKLQKATSADERQKIELQIAKLKRDKGIVEAQPTVTYTLDGEKVVVDGRYAGFTGKTRKGYERFVQRHFPEADPYATITKPVATKGKTAEKVEMPNSKTGEKVATEAKGEVTAEVTPLPKGEKLPEKPATRAEEIKEEAPSYEKMLEDAKKGWISDRELGIHGKRLGEDWSKELEVTDKAFKEAVKHKELGGKVVRGETYNEALAKAIKDCDEDLGKVYDRVMARDEYIVETPQSAADKHALLLSLIKKAGEGDKTAVLMHLKVIDKMDAAASLGGHMLQLQSYVLRNSPEGRLRWTMREIARLEKEYEKNLNGKHIELTGKQLQEIIDAKTPKQVADTMEKIGKEIWKQIPSSKIEAMNQIRHFAMLFNPKTHARNMGGNSVFAGARALSDTVEIGLTKAFNKRITTLSGVQECEGLIKQLEAKVKTATPKEQKELRNQIKETRKLLNEAKNDANSPMKQFLAHGEVGRCESVLNERFDIDYKTDGGKQTGRWQEGKRTAGYLYEQSGNKAKDLLAKGTNKAIDANYWLLDREDRTYFLPAYRRAYVRWCKSRGIVDKATKQVTPEILENMSKDQMQEATAYAMRQAKIATFRDDSAISDRIIAWKRATENKQGKGLGTYGYRALNVGLESVLPFVKTPVNILRRGMDYSPIGLFRGIGDAVLAKDAETFMRGIHQMSTGLTGSGIALLGWWAASHDWVMIHAGEVSGDEYYDRDMGYQDYSITVFGKSYSMDWLAPVQFAFFQGAAIYKELGEKGFSPALVFNALEAGFEPMMEMSFMSSAKDTVESFMERAYRDGTDKETNPAMAIARTLFGSVPQGWLSGFVPQLVNQGANFADSKQRDTSSTAENEWVRSWESFGRKMQNRIPFYRNKLEAKVNHRGEEVANDSQNVLTKFANAFANPMNVKTITLDKYDKAVIDGIFGSEDIDQETKDKAGYWLTGNIPLEIDDKGNRLTYKQKHDYVLAKRADMWNNWKEAVDAKSFNDMTDNMKAEELKDYHYLGLIKGDLTVYDGTKKKWKYALDKILEQDTDGKHEKDQWKNMKNFGGNAKLFVESQIATKKFKARTHDDNYHTKALAIHGMGLSEKQEDIVYKTYDVYGDKIEPAKIYLDEAKNKTKALLDYANAMCSGNAVCEKNEVTTSTANFSVALAKVKGGVPEKVYRARGYDWNSAQAGGGLVKAYGYDYASLAKMKSDALMEYDEGRNNQLSKAETINYIESLGIKSSDEKACLFEYFAPANSKNPYGTILDHLEWGTEPDETGGSGGRGRRGRRGGRGGGGSGGKGKVPNTASGAINGKVTNPFSTSNGSSASNLNDAYRKKARKLREQSRKS